MNTSHSHPSAASQSHRKRNAGGRFIPGARAKALAAGALHYETGTPCKRGHIAPRLVSTRVCLECARMEAAARREQAQREKCEAARPGVRRFASKVAEELERNFKASAPDG